MSLKITEAHYLGLLRAGWIPTSERLPGLAERVLIWVRPGRVEVARLWHSKIAEDRWGFDDDDERCWSLADVSHWMPLPEPPK